MPKPYYTNTDLENFPLQVNQITKFLKIWISSIIYQTEDYETVAKERFIRGNITSERASKENVRSFFQTHWKFPFTVFNFGDPVPDETVLSHNAKSYNLYCEALGDYVAARPMIMEMPFLSFFNTNRDYFTALKKLQDAAMSVAKLDVPIVIDGVTDSYIIEVDMPDVSRAELAEDWERYEETGRIFDILHTIQVKFFDYSLASGLESNTGSGSGGNSDRRKIVYPVDNIIFYMKKLSDKSLIHSGQIPDELEVSGIIPVDQATGVALDSSIQITFTNPIKESSITDAITFLPDIEGNLETSVSGTVLTFSPYNNLDSNTVYNITVHNDEIEDIYNGRLAEDYTFSFTTA
jgi:hypothetical protein